MHDFTPIPAVIGGILIGLSASLLLLTHGKVAGISGIVGGLFQRSQLRWRRASIAFLVGLLVAGVIARFVSPAAFVTTTSSSSSSLSSFLLIAVAGILVGFGTQLGNGCTSGHGVCGLSRLSIRSLIATGTFMATAAVTVMIVHHVLGGGGAQ